MLLRVRTLQLAPGRARAVWQGHPWIHARSVAQLDPGTDAEDAVAVRDAEGRLVGTALLSEASAIRARVLVRGEACAAVDEVLVARIGRAAAWRKACIGPESGEGEPTDAYRLVHAEGDGLPGLIVDRWADVLVAQFATQPMWRRRAHLAEALLEATGARLLLSRPAGHEAREGIAYEPFARPTQAPVPESIEIQEHGARLIVDLAHGQKTGHYADQRDNRRQVARLHAGETFLDLFCGTGGFGVQAGRTSAARVTYVDRSERTIETAKRNHALNADLAAATFEVAEADEWLKSAAARKAQFDTVVLDPPNLSPRAGTERRAQKHLRELNVRALTRVRPGGLLATYSCSPRIDGEALLDLLQSAARDCRVTFQVVAAQGPPPDHPHLVLDRMGRYLAGWVVRVSPW